jgi:FtsZ-binding cell division protein ZapB
MSTATTMTVTCSKCSKEFKRRSGLDWHLANFKFCRVNQWPEQTNVVEVLPETDPRLLDKNGRPLWGNALKMRIAKIAELDAKPSKKIKVTADNGSHELSKDGGLDDVELDASVRKEWENRYEQIEKELKQVFDYSLHNHKVCIDDVQDRFEKQQQIDSEAITQLQIEVARLKDENATQDSEAITTYRAFEQMQTEIARLKDRVDDNEAGIYAVESDIVTDDSDNNKLAAQVERLIGEQHAINDALLTLIPNETS